MSKGISIHIGLNLVDPGHYGGWSGPLAACEYDAEDMNAIAESKGYESTILLTKNATRAAVIGAIKDAAGKLDSGDILFLTYSGHGGQVPDSSGDESDMKDETWCLYDGELIDDELYEGWAAFKEGVRICVLSDSCHSGTATRDVAQQAVQAGNDKLYRVMPDDAAARTYRTNRTFYDNIQRNLKTPPDPVVATVRLMSGCQDNQLSRDGIGNGAFTGRLISVYNNGQYQGNYAAFHKEIISKMLPDQSPNMLVFGSDNPDFADESPFTI